MDYEKAYKELIEKLRKAKDDIDVCDDRYCVVIDDLVPELAESEDERIIKELIGFIDKVHKDNNILLLVADMVGDDIPNMIPSWIAYLEKQKEQKPERINITEMVAKYRVTDEYIEGEYKGKPVNCMIRAYEQGIRDTLLKVKLQKQKAIRMTGSFVDGSYKFDVVDMPKPAEWSEEDDIIIDGIIANLEYLLCNTVLVQSTKENIEARLRWMKRLKSLRPQPHWKPSEEQMEALYTAAREAPIIKENGNYLYDLYDDLKKL